ncbi:hypothetical protein SAMN04487947_1229 [Halogeometricum rufum]|uniref:Uncharacterized protein n=1 Tax=Halogeometricum rufum TaxID=553469 RepID=A0A1I6GIW9_9EURY|nr:hypothetical protein [Halogeometricum rufum]SFR42142.1 hypothetical protein SAMN04487947_1229 [Halogeometricum rufum]
MPDRARWTGTHSYRRHSHDEIIERGEEFEPTEQEWAAFGDSLDPVAVDDADGEDGEEEDGNEDVELEAPFDPSEKTIDELEAALADGELSEAELKALLEAEKSGKHRNGATDVLDDALSEA